MVVFWFLAAAMTAVALAFVLVPLLRARAVAGPSEAEANLEVLRSQRREIEADVAAGTLPADVRDEALEELVGRAADDLAVAPPVPTAPMRRAWVPAAVAAVAIPVLAFGLYAALGLPQAADPRFAAGDGGMDQAQIVAMVERLALKVKDRPDDAQGCALLARSMAALGRFKEAADAYARVATLVPNDANVLADYADVLGMAQDRNLAGRPVQLARQALEINPRHEKALALLGTAALDAGDLRGSLGYWEALAEVVPPDSPDAAEVKQIVADLRQRLAAGPAMAAAPPRKMFEKALAGAAAVSGVVSVGPELRGKLSGSETVFIFARADAGSRAPLAVLRASARDLPIAFKLDDSQAMAPGLTISSVAALRVEARITRSGNATPQSGDLTGASPVVKPGAGDVKVVVDTVLP